MLARAAAVTTVVASAGCVAFAGWVRTLPRDVVLPMNDAATLVIELGVSTLSWAVSGLVLVWLRPRNLVGWLLLALGASEAWQIGASAYGGYGTAVADPQWPGARWVALTGGASYLPLVFGPATLLLALYPNGRLPARWWRWPVAAAATGIALATASASLWPEVWANVAPGQPVPVDVPPAFLKVVFWAVSLPLVVGSTVVICVGTVVRLVRATAPERQQLALVASAVALKLAGTFAYLPDWTAGLLTSLLPVAVALGVLRYRLLGIQVIVNRGLVYGALTGAVVLAYLLAAAGTGSALGRHPLPAILAAAVVAIGLIPVRGPLQRAVDELVYGPRGDPLRAATRLADATELDLLPAALTALVDGVRAPGADIVAADGRVIARVGTAGEPVECVPLRIAGEHVGVLLLGPVGSDGDRRLLAAVTPQLAAVVRALSLAEALEAERDRMVEATRAERDDLHRDLHDGLGPSLAGIDLGLQGLDDALRNGDRQTSAARLDRISGETTKAVAEVRRLIDELRATDL